MRRKRTFNGEVLSVDAIRRHGKHHEIVFASVVQSNVLFVMSGLLPIISAVNSASIIVFLLFPLQFDFCQSAHRRGTRRNIINNHGIGADIDVVADRQAAEDRRAAPDIDPMADARRA